MDVALSAVRGMSSKSFSATGVHRGQKESSERTPLWLFGRPLITVTSVSLSFMHQ